MVIEDLQSAHAHAGPCVVEIHFDRIVLHGNHPEYVVRIDVHVEVVDLLRQVRRSDRTGIEVQSDKDESPLVTVTVRPDELPLTKSHVRLVC
jgi:hypothetical protein